MTVDPERKAMMIAMAQEGKTQLYGIEKGDTRLSFDKDKMIYRKFEE